MSDEFACPFCDQFPQALVKGEIHEIIKSSLGRASECEGERLSCRPTFFGRTSKACAANKRYLRYLRYLRSDSQCLLSFLSLSLQSMSLARIHQEQTQVFDIARGAGVILISGNQYLIILICIKTSMIFGLISKNIFQAENSTFHAEHKIWRRPKYICCKQCNSCKPTLHLLSRMQYSSPSQNTSILLRLLRLLLNTVNMLQEPVSRDFNHRPSAPSAELDYT